MTSLVNDDNRLDFRVPVDIVLNKYVNGRPYLCRATNISRCGVLLHRVFEPSHETTNVGLQFQLPGSDRVITCAARVVHQEGSRGGYGVRFTHLAPEHQTMIDSFILDNLDWPELI